MYRGFNKGGSGSVSAAKLLLNQPKYMMPKTVQVSPTNEGRDKSQTARAILSSMTEDQANEPMNEETQSLISKLKEGQKKKSTLGSSLAGIGSSEVH